MRPLLVIFLCAFIVMSCTDGPSAIGSGFFEDGTLEIQYVDSLTVEASTVRFDSLVTSDATRFLVGYHHDQDVGNLTASAIFQIAPANALSLDEDFTTYSRTALVLVPDGYSYFDTLTSVSLSVHKLTQPLELNNGYLYNTSSFAYEAEPIGALTFRPKPNAFDTVEISLSDSFGRAIFTMAQQEAEEVSSAANFIKAFSGMAILPGTSTSAAILGYGTSPEVRIYYWDKTQTPSEEKFLTVKGGSYIKYNKIIHDREGTPLSLIPNHTLSLSSTLTNDVAYVQAGSGLALRLEIPYLRSVLLENDDLTLTDAVLEFYPLQDDERNTPLPESFSVSVVNYKNGSYQSSQSLQAFLVEDEYLGRDTRYEIDIRSFVTRQLAAEEINENALLFALEGLDFRQSVDIIRIGNQESEKKMKLKLYCVISKN